MLRFPLRSNRNRTPSRYSASKERTVGPSKFNTCLSRFVSSRATTVVVHTHDLYGTCGCGNGWKRLVFNFSQNPEPLNHRVADRSKLVLISVVVMMRRVNVNGVFVLSRAIGGGAAVSTAADERLLRLALYGTSDLKANSNPQWLTPRARFDSFGSSGPSIANGVAGTRFFSAAATSLAKESSRPDNFSPKDVVLYQYEACPFCNKVRGKN